jgi:hypothetical protein
MAVGHASTSAGAMTMFCQCKATEHLTDRSFSCKASLLPDDESGICKSCVSLIQLYDVQLTWHNVAQMDNNGGCLTWQSELRRGHFAQATSAFYIEYRQSTNPLKLLQDYVEKQRQGSDRTEA